MIRILRSPLLPLILTAALAPLLALSTVLPRDHPLAGHRFFRSPLFVAPALLYVAGAVAAAADRRYRRKRGRGARAAAPDFVPLGLVVVAIGGLVSLSERASVAFTLRWGDVVDLPEGWRIAYVDIQATPRDWTSTVRVERVGDTPRTERIEVGRPLRLGALRVYQTGAGTEGLVRLWDGGRGLEITLRQGELRRIGDRRWRLVGIDQGQARVEEWLDNETVNLISAGFGNFVGPFSLQGLTIRPTTLLTATRDPGSPVVLTGLILSGAAVAWSAWRRLARRAPR